jgi:hypothetical protein
MCANGFRLPVFEPTGRAHSVGAAPAVKLTSGKGDG